MKQETKFVMKNKKRHITRGIKNWSLSGYSIIQPRINFCNGCKVRNHAISNVSYLRPLVNSLRFLSIRCYLLKNLKTCIRNNSFLNWQSNNRIGFNIPAVKEI